MKQISAIYTPQHHNFFQQQLKLQNVKCETTVALKHKDMNSRTLAAPGKSRKRGFFHFF